MFAFGLFLTAGLAQVSLEAPVSLENRETWVTREGVLTGDPDTCQKPAQVDVKKVWAAIPEVIQIRRENPGPAARDILVSKATARFQAALQAEMNEGGFDCVVRVGSITGDPPCEVPDVTQSMIARVKKS